MFLKTYIESPQHVHDGCYRTDRNRQLPQFQRQRKLEQIALGKPPATPTPLGVAEIGNDDALFTEVDQPVLWLVQQPRRF